MAHFQVWVQDVSDLLAPASGAFQEDVDVDVAVVSPKQISGFPADEVYNRLFRIYDLNLVMFDLPREGVCLCLCFHSC